MSAEARQTKSVQTAIRVTPEIVDQAVELGRLWGPVKPLSLADVFATCVRRVHEEETKTKKQEKRR